MKNEIIVLLKKLDFEIMEINGKFTCFLNKNNIHYEIFIGKKITDFTKIENSEIYSFCPESNTLEVLYNSILEEFKYELRKKKIKDILH